MINDWLNQNPEDDFNPNDHDIEMDEIAKLHAMADMKDLNIDQVNVMLENMINVFSIDEEYEKCHICNEIKKGLDNA